MSELDHLEEMTVDELQGWLERALRGREPLSLIVPDEHPFLAIARLEDTLDRSTRRDLCKAAHLLVVELARGAEADDEYVVALTGLVVELDVQDSTSVLSEIARAKGFGDRPLRQQAAVLGAILDLRHSMPDSFWMKVLRSGRNVPLALRALLERGSSVLAHLPTIAVDQDTADVLYIVLKQHTKRLDGERRDELVKRVQSVVGTCSGEMRAMLEDWLDEQGASVGDDASMRSDQEFRAFFAVIKKRYQLIHLQRSQNDARLDAA